MLQKTTALPPHFEVVVGRLVSSRFVSVVFFVAIILWYYFVHSLSGLVTVGV